MQFYTFFRNAFQYHILLTIMLLVIDSTMCFLFPSQNGISPGSRPTATARVSPGLLGHVRVGPLQLGLDKWFDANVRETSNYSPNEECSATATTAGKTGCSCRRATTATYCDRPITPGEVPKPKFLDVEI